MSDFDPFDDLAADLSSASDEDRETRQQEDETDLKWLIADFRGRRFLRRLLGSLGVFRASFTGDALSTVFREGERNAGLVLLHRAMRAAPDKIGQLLTEDTNG